MSSRPAATRRSKSSSPSAASAPTRPLPPSRSASHRSGTATRRRTNAPYGLAKKLALVQQQAYHAQHGFASAYLLLANLYGPGDDFHPDSSHVIPALIRKFVAAAESGAPSVEIWGSGEATREFLYVDDAVDAILLAAERIETPQAVNIGTGREISICQLAECIARETGFEGELTWDRTRPDGQARRALDVTAARARLGWSAATTLEEGLRATIAWWRGGEQAAA